MKTSSTANCRFTTSTPWSTICRRCRISKSSPRGKRSAYTLNRYNDALKTVAAKYYHRLELVDDFNHLDDTILKFGPQRTRQPDPGNSAEAARGAGGHGHRGGHRLRQHRLNYPGCAQSQRLRILQQRWGIEDHEVVAFGDSGNDIEMLQHAGFGFCHGQRPEDVSRRPLSGAA